MGVIRRGGSGDKMTILGRLFLLPRMFLHDCEKRPESAKGGSPGAGSDAERSVIGPLQRGQGGGVGVAIFLWTGGHVSALSSVSRVKGEEAMRRGAISMVLIAILGCHATDPNPRKEDPMTPRMKNPAMVIPEAMQAILALKVAVKKGGIPPKTLELVHLRVSQINGCHVCIDAGIRQAAKGGEAEERLCAVPKWRDVTCFTDPERAALRLAESVTRLSDKVD